MIHMEAQESRLDILNNLVLLGCFVTVQTVLLLRFVPTDACIQNTVGRKPCVRASAGESHFISKALVISGENRFTVRLWCLVLQNFYHSASFILSSFLSYAN